MWLFLNSNDYNSTILKSVNLGNDTDTIAAITGSLLGIYYGLDSINDKIMFCRKTNRLVISLFDYNFINFSYYILISD